MQPQVNPLSKYAKEIRVALLFVILLLLPLLTLPAIGVIFIFVLFGLLLHSMYESELIRGWVMSQLRPGDSQLRPGGDGGWGTERIESEEPGGDVGNADEPSG